jgi:hypothetical protein
LPAITYGETEFTTEWKQAAIMTPDRRRKGANEEEKKPDRTMVPRWEFDG